MAIKMRVNRYEEDEKEEKVRSFISKKDKYGKISPLKFGLATGLSLAILVFVISFAASFGIFESFSSSIFAFYDLGANLGVFGVLIAGLYTFLYGFVLASLIALFYDFFL